MSDFANMAPRYWEKGLSVVPVKPGTKRPILKNWSKYLDCPPDAATKEKWKIKYSQNGLALLLGTKLNGKYIFGIDVDDDRWLTAVKYILQAPICGKCGKKGATFFCQVPESSKLKSTTLRGSSEVGNIDILGQGRCTIIPPTTHPETQKPYYWEENSILDMDISELPVFDHRKQKLLKTVVESEHSPVILNGTGTNNAVLRFTGQLVGAGAVDEQIFGIIRALLPESYKGNSLEELQGMINGARAKGFDEESDKKSKSEKQSLAALNLLKNANIDLFHNPFHEAFAEIQLKEGSKISYPLWSSTVKGLVQYVFFREEGKPLSAMALNEVMSILDAEARFVGPQEETYVRIASHKDSVYIDLGRDDGLTVRITKHGWELTTEHPIRFLRPAGFEALPIPTRGQDYLEMHSLLGISGQNSTLRLAFELNCLNPNGPYMALLTQGQQGSGKTFHNKTIKDTIDPSAAPKMRLPKSEQDLAIQAKDNHLLSYDNASRLRWEMSDVLCTLATGGGLVARKLYTDDESKIFKFMRPFMLNGIGDYADRPDLLERAIQIDLEAMRKDSRKSERQLNTAFEKLLPGYLGFLYGCVSCALNNINEVEPPTRLRMADTAHWLVAAEPATGFPEGSFIAAIENVQQEMYVDRVINNPICIALFRLLKDTDEYEGTVGDLYDKLEDSDNQRRFGLPRSPAAFSSALKRISPMLEKIGIFHEFLGKDRNGMNIKVWFDEDRSELDLGFSSTKNPGF